MSGANIFLKLAQFPEPTHCYGTHTRFSTGEVTAKLGDMLQEGMLPGTDAPTKCPGSLGCHGDTGKGKLV